MAEDKDMYGTPRDQASQVLDRYLHDTLREPHAAMRDLRLIDGRWQAHVDNSARGIRVLFLEQHSGQIQPGFADVDDHPETPLKEW
ncbi:MAG TPA: hypothetical protein V6D47_03280 [Oscillatoriaceae cyanobacterium]